MGKLFIRSLLSAAALSVAAVSIFALWAGGSGSRTEGTSSGAASVAAEGEAAYAVEDFAYPQADKILAEQGITLKRGDGHIVLAECDSQAGLLEVWPRHKTKVCFRVTGNEGYLSLEIPAVYGVRGNDYQTEVSMTVGEEEKQYDIERNTWTAVGETAELDDRNYMLVEIVSSK